MTVFFVLNWVYDCIGKFVLFLLYLFVKEFFHVRGFNMLLGLCSANIPMIRNIKYNYSDVVMKQADRQASKKASKQASTQAGKQGRQGRKQTASRHIGKSR